MTDRTLPVTQKVSVSRSEQPCRQSAPVTLYPPECVSGVQNERSDKSAHFVNNVTSEVILFMVSL